MMISSIIKELEEAVSPLDVSPDNVAVDWDSLTRLFAPKIYDLGNTIVASITPVVGGSSLKKSKIECVASKKNCLTVAEFRIRPEAAYYNKSAIPATETPNGSHSTGCEFSISLLAPNLSRKKIIPSRVVIEFQVWGHKERHAFGEMLKDYKRPIKKLIDNKKYHFFSSVPFDNVEGYKGKDAFNKLHLYYGNDVDPENTFTISKEFTAECNMSDIVKASIPLMVLYDCTLGYSSVKKSKDRMLALLNKLGAA